MKKLYSELMYKDKFYAIINFKVLIKKVRKLTDFLEFHKDSQQCS